MLEIDPNRLDRVHVETVRFSDNKFWVILSDGSKIEWNQWCSYDKKERWGY